MLRLGIKASFLSVFEVVLVLRSEKSLVNLTFKSLSKLILKVLVLLSFFKKLVVVHSNRNISIKTDLCEYLKDG